MAKRRVGADYGWVGPVAILAALGGAGYLVWKYVLPSLQSGNSANNASTTAANSSASAASQAADATAGVTPTLSANEMANIANQVYSLGKNVSTATDLAAINSQLTQVNNIADLNGVIAAFGTKNIPSGDITSSFNLCFSLGIGCTAVGLASFISVLYAAYDTDGQYLASLNDYFSGQGINYTF